MKNFLESLKISFFKYVYKQNREHIFSGLTYLVIAFSSLEYVVSKKICT